ncbi:MAG: hypothetical protein LBS06_04655 [Treponema sp.]|jgi:hypothetical protein|nr:hypothetical protein [Treponema sp.]
MPSAGRAIAAAFAVWLLVPLPLHPQSAAGPITAIHIEGLKRTKVATAERPLRRFIGRNAAALDFNEIKAVVLDTGILEPLSVEIVETEAGNILSIAVQEKWAIFPVPVFFAGSGRVMAGAAFYDANAFGLNDKMAVMGAYQTNGWTTTMMYIHSPAGDWSTGWRAAVRFVQEEREDVNQKDETIRRFAIDSLAASGALLYHFTGPLSGAFRLGYTGHILETGGSPLLAPARGSQTIDLGPEFSIRDSEWDGCFLSERSAVFSYRYSAGINASGIDSPSFHSLSFQGIFEQSIVPGFRVNARSGLLWAPLAPVLSEFSPGAAEVAILPGAFSARHYAGISLGLEKYLFKISHGSLAFLTAWQMVYSHGSILGNQFDYGVSAAFSFYLSRLAIPAIGVGVSYNIPADFFQFSFSMGVSM